MSRVVHFEICAQDPERAARFYEQALGWTFAAPPGPERYWLATTGEKGTPGIDGGLMDRHFPQPVINTIEVASLAETTARIEAAGGKKMMGPNRIPNVGLHAYLADPEGTLFGVLEPSPRE